MSKLFNKLKQRLGGSDDRPGPAHAENRPLTPQSGANGPARFVRIDRTGTGMEVDGNSFNFVGANCYYLQACTAVVGQLTGRKLARWLGVPMSLASLGPVGSCIDYLCTKTEQCTLYPFNVL